MTGSRSLNTPGTALMPQAGVAIGLALYAGQAMPRFQSSILPLILALSIVFELVGPILTRTHLGNVGEIKSKDSSQ